MESCGVENMLVTRSEHGMSLISSAGETTHLSARAREVYDVSGAGDTVVATLAAAYGGGVSLPDAARLSNLAAGIVVARVGTAVARSSDLVELLKQERLSTTNAKILSVDEALEKVELWRRNGLEIGFTNGCFDLLHPGHLSLLEQAADACDRLIVAINSDPPA